MARQVAGVAYAHYYAAYLRGLDVTAELDALCEEWGWRIYPEPKESVIRKNLAYAADGGFLTEADLDAAKARARARPSCSQTLIERGVARP
ncbi:MAG: hypothetical protein MI723_09065 [Caulobacterales bacterium]|nr:hypothetical protein [Caulobacterales bacterium]